MPDYLIDQHTQGQFLVGAAVTDAPVFKAQSNGTSLFTIDENAAVFSVPIKAPIDETCRVELSTSSIATATCGAVFGATVMMFAGLLLALRQSRADKAYQRSVERAWSGARTTNGGAE